MITFYGYNKCGTSRKGQKALDEWGAEYKFVDITEKPPSKAALKKAIKLSEEPIKKFFNTSGKEYKENNVKDKLPSMKEGEMVEMLAANGRLIKRPVVTDGEKATVGFDEEKFAKAWKPKGASKKSPKKKA